MGASSVKVQVPLTTAHSPEEKEEEGTHGMREMRENWYCCSEVQRGWLQELQDLWGEGEIMCSFTTNINQAGKQLSLESFCDAEKAQKPSPVISITRDNKCKGRQ